MKGYLTNLAKTYFAKAAVSREPACASAAMQPTLMICLKADDGDLIVDSSWRPHDCAWKKTLLIGAAS